MNEETRWFKPARADVVVRDPITREPLPAEGAEKPLDTYWCRRVADGDVVEGAPAAAERVEPRLSVVQTATEEGQE